MSEQLSLLVPSEGGMERFQARLLARREDPPTSKQAAQRLTTSERHAAQQQECLDRLTSHGPGTTWELANGETYTHHMLARRLPELERKGLVRTTGKMRDGSREWELTPDTA